MSKMSHNRKIDLSNLPKKTNGVDWTKSVGYSISFEYGDIVDSFKIVDYNKDTNTVSIDYHNNIIKISRGSITSVKLGVIVGYTNLDYKYNIGDDTCNHVGKIVSRYKKNTKNSTRSRFYKIQCYTCKCIFDRLEGNMEKDYGCPICNNKTVIRGINDIWTTNPNIAKQLKHKTDGYLYSIGQRVYLDWICPICHREIPHITPKQVLKTIDSCVPCEYCSDSFSYPNKFLANLFKEIGLNVKSEYNPKWESLGQRRYDFFFEDNMIIVEAHGGQHYDKRFPEIQINDIEKRNIALNNGIVPENYIELNCSKSSCDYIINQINHTILSNILHFTEDQIKRADFHARQNLIQHSIDVLQKHNFSLTKASEELHIHYATLSRYLKDAIANNLIDANVVREKRSENKKKIHYQLDSTPILDLYNNIAYGSYTELKKYIPTLVIGNIKESIKRNGTAYGRKWKIISKQEFNKHKKTYPNMSFGEYFMEE